MPVPVVAALCGRVVARADFQERPTLHERGATAQAQDAERAGGGQDRARTRRASVDREYARAFDEYKTFAAQRLELALACSFGFWTTVGLLIG